MTDTKTNSIFNLYTIVAANIIIIAATLISRTYFLDSGIIHGIAGIFILLALTRILAPRLIKDPVIRKFAWWTAIGLVIFAASHFIEFLSFYLAHDYNDANFANVANFFIISLSMIVIGIESILSANYSRPKSVKIVAAGLAAAAVVLTVVFLSHNNLVSFEPDSALTYIYTVVILGVGAFVFVNLLEVKRLVADLNRFANYILVGSMLIVVSALLNTIYEILVDLAGVPVYQIIYLAHFLFYAAISALFLGFGQPLLDYVNKTQDQ